MAAAAVLAAGAVRANEPDAGPDHAPSWVLDQQETPDWNRFAIQRRVYAMRHELQLAAASLPSHPLYKAYGVHVAYTFHATPTWAWEAVAATFCANLDTGLKGQLLVLAQAVGPTLPVMPQVEGILSSRLILTPLYGKQSWQTLGPAHFEAMAGVGPALLVTRTHNQFTRLAAGIDVGVGLRIWLSRQISLRLDVSDVVFAVSRTSGHVVRLAMGLGVELGEQL